MNLGFLHAQQLVNRLAQDKKLDTSIYFLDKKYQNCLLVDPSLVDAVMKSSAVVPFDIWTYYLKILKKEPHQLKYLSGYFSHGPLLKNGNEHRQVRIKMARYYQMIESHLTTWKPLKIEEISLNDSLIVFPDLVDAYCDQFFCETLSSLLNSSKEWSVPKDPIFKIFPNTSDLESVNQSFDDLYEQVENFSEFAKEDFWILSSILIMGNDALRSALHFALDQKIFPTDHSVTAIADWYESIAPVSIIVRKAIADINVDAYHIANQANIYYSPYLTGLAATNGERGGFAFGRGPHLCPGRSIAIKAAALFFQCYNSSGELSIIKRKSNGKIWRRRLVLEQIDVKTE